MDQLKSTINDILVDTRYAGPLAVVKAARNGAVYGAKIRFPHALVMVFLFRSGTVRDKLRLVLRATRQHARNLALYAGLYKLTLYVLRSTRPSQKELAPDAFVAGLLGGYIVFGRGGTRQSNVNQQITIYVFARVVLALAKLIIRNYLFRDRYRQQRHAQAEFYGMGDSAWTGKRMPPVDAWPLFASLSWAFVMYLFRWYPETLQPSLRSSMKYIYTNADQWDNLRNFLWHNQ